MGERVLVTGGAGFIGSHLVDELVSRGHDVRVFDNLSPQVHGPVGKIPAHLNTDAEFIKGDVRDRDGLRRALEGVDVVFHLAAAVGVGQSMYQIREYVEVNTLGAACLLDLIANERPPVRKMIVASSMSIYGEGACRRTDGTVVHPPLRSTDQLRRRRWDLRDPETGERLTPCPTPESKPLQPTSIYAITKRDHEEMFLATGAAYGTPAVALRFFNVYGTRQALSNPYTGVMAIFSARLLNGHAPIIFEDGKQARDFVHVSDVVQGLVLAMERDTGLNAVLNIGTGEFTTILHVAQRLAAALAVESEPELPGEFRAGDIRACVADIAAARQMLGYEPKVALGEGIEGLIGWVQGQTAQDNVTQAVEELRRRGLTG